MKKNYKLIEKYRRKLEKNMEEGVCGDETFPKNIQLLLPKLLRCLLKG